MMAATAPLVSVIIPVKNRPDLLAEALESLRAQTLETWEAVVVDDHSTDGTRETTQARYTFDPRIRVLLRTGARGGAPVCRNQGARAAAGRYLVFLDSDDLLAPFGLEQRVQVMQGDPTLAFATFPAELFAERPGDLGVMWNRFGGDPDLTRFLRWDTPWQTTGPIWTRAAVEQLGGWDEALPCWQDAEWHVRALLRGLRYVAIDRRDSYVRRGGAVSDGIHQQKAKPAYLNGKLHYFRGLSQQLREAGALTPHHRSLVVASFLHLAREWIWNHQDRGQAGQVWRACYEERLISTAEWYEGRLGLTLLEDRPVLARLFDRYIHGRWSGCAEVATSATAGKTPAQYSEVGLPLAGPKAEAAA